MTKLPMKPSARTVLNQLRDNPAGVTTHDFVLAGCGSRFGARIGELRALGFVIKSERLPLPARGDRYWLTFDVERDSGTPDQAPPSRSGPADTGSAVPLNAGLFDSDGFRRVAGAYEDAA